MKKLLFILLFFLSNYFYAQVNFSSGVSKFKTEDYKGAIDEFTKVIDANQKTSLLTLIEHLLKADSTITKVLWKIMTKFTN